jgi:hypothetical protein
VGSDCSDGNCTEFTYNHINGSGVGLKISTKDAPLWLTPASGVAVGTTSAPTTEMDIDGAMRTYPQNSAPTCDASTAGAIYYSSATSKHYGCNGSTWNALY